MAKVDFSGLDNMFAGMDFGAPETNIQPQQGPVPAQVKQENITVNEQPTAANSLSLLQSAQAKMSQIAVELNQQFVERDQLIKIMLLSVATGTNLVMLGPPGTARIDIVG